jgi:glutaredoxin
LLYEEINIEEINMSRDDLVKITGGRTVPQIVIEGAPIGGFDALMKLNQNGKLDQFQVESG